MLELRVYFQELNYQVIEEIPAYSYETLLGTCRRKIRKLDLRSHEVHGPVVWDKKI